MMQDELNEMQKLKLVQDAEGSRQRLFFSAPQGAVTGFIEFVRDHGVVGLAIGFVLGGAVSKVTTSFSADIINPILSSFFGTERLADVMLGPISVGKFAAAVLDFFILAIAVYLIFKAFRLDRLHKK